MPRDDTVALALFQRACDGSGAKGCFNLAVGYENGRGVPRDADRALALYRQACGLGNDRACTESARLGAPPR